MLTTRVLFLVAVVCNLSINGLALLHNANTYVTWSDLVPVALVFNLVVWPVAVFATYRMGGMTEEMYRSSNRDAVLVAAATQRPVHQKHSGGSPNQKGSESV